MFDSEPITKFASYKPLRVLPDVGGLWTDEEDEDEGDGGDLPGEGHLARVGVLGDVEFLGGDLLEEEVDRNSVLVREVSPSRSLVPC